jgi:hypothetical protein
VPERVFLHIGPHKSGSTYLQSRLWANRAFLHERGIHLPGDAQIDHFRAGLDLRGLPAHGAVSPPVGSWDRLVAQVRNSDARTVLVTDERLAAASSPHAARALRSLAPLDVHVIYAVREFSGLLPSEWQERIKLALDTPFDTWLEGVATRGGPSFWRAHCLGNVFARWSVARDHVHLLIVPPGTDDRDELWRRFASIIDAPGALPNDSVRGNRSLGVVESETVRRVYLRLERPRPPARIEQVMKEVVGHYVLVPREEATTIRLPESCRAWVDHQTNRRRAFLDSGGCQVVGDPDELAVDPSRFVSDVFRPADAELLDAAVHVVGELTARIARQQRRHRGSVVTPRPSAPRSVLAEVGRRTRVAVANRVGRTYFLVIGPPATGTQGSPRQRATTWERLVSDAERSGERQILIVDDTLASARRKEIRRLRHRVEGAEVHVIYVLRDLPTLLAVAWQRSSWTLPTPPWMEWLTDTSDGDPVARCLAPAHDVGAVLDRWCDGGADHVHVLVHPRTPSSKVLRLRLQAIVGATVGMSIDESGIGTGIGLLDPAAAEVVRRARELIGGADPRRDLARVTEGLVLRGVRPAPPDATFSIPEPARPWVEAQSAARRSYAASGRCEVVGDLAELDISDSSYSPTVGLPSDSAALDAATEIAAALVTELAAVRWPDDTRPLNSRPGA